MKLDLPWTLAVIVLLVLANSVVGQLATDSDPPARLPGASTQVQIAHIRLEGGPSGGQPRALVTFILPAARDLGEPRFGLEISHDLRLWRTLDASEFERLASFPAPKGSLQRVQVRLKPRPTGVNYLRVRLIEAEGDGAPPTLEEPGASTPTAVAGDRGLTPPVQPGGGPTIAPGDDSANTQRPVLDASSRSSLRPTRVMADDPDPRIQSVVEAIETGRYPERLSLQHPPKPFSRDGWEADPQSYLNVIEPGRVFQVSENSNDPELVVLAPTDLEVVVGDLVEVQVRTSPNAPVSLHSPDGGIFQGPRLNSVTVRADGTGLATAWWYASPGTLNEARVLVGSPMARFTQTISLFVAPRGTSGRTRTLSVANLAPPVTDTRGPAEIAQNGEIRNSTSDCHNSDPNPCGCCNKLPPCDPPVPTGTCTGPSWYSYVTGDHRHEALDFAIDRAAGGAAGCDSCVGGVGADFPAVGRLPQLTLWRYHRPGVRVRGLVGIGQYCEYDTRIWVNLNPNGQPWVTLFRPEHEGTDTWFREISARDGDDQIDGVLHDDRAAFDSLTFYADGPYDSTEALSQITTNFNTATVAVIRTHDGRRMVFEMYDGNTRRHGRLLRREDRNGNGVRISYLFPPNATRQELMPIATFNPREKLYLIERITDAYGNSMHFTYSAARMNGIHGPSGHIPVERIHFPNGTSATYHYEPDTDRLIRVDLPGTDADATFAYGYDAAMQADTITYDDPSADGVHRRMKAWYSTTTYMDPDTQQIIPMAAGFLRRAETLDGELIMAVWFGNDPLSPGFYVHEGGNLLRFVVRSGHAMHMQAVATDFVPPAERGAIPDVTALHWLDIYKNITDGEIAAIESMTDPWGRVQDFTWNGPQRTMVGTAFPDGTDWSQEINPFSQPTQRTDRLGRLEIWTYDPKGNRLSETRAAGTPAASTWTWIYNSRGQPLSATDANGNVRNFAYDARGFLIEVLDPPDEPGGPRARTTFAYDPFGRLASATDPLGRMTSYAYDERGRMTNITHADQSTETFIYGTGEFSNLVVEQKDRSGSRTTYTHDTWGRVIRTLTAAGTPEQAEETCSYLTGTTLQALCVDRGNQTQYGYDYLNRRVSTVRFPSQGVSLASTTVLDQVGRTLEESDPYGRRTFYVYDVNDRLVRTVRETVPGGVGVLSSPEDPPPGGVPPTGTPGVPFPLSAREAGLAAMTRGLSPNAPYLINDVELDAEGQTVASIDPRGVRTEYTYDAQGRRTRQVEAAGTLIAAITEWDYDPQGNVIAMRRPRHFTEPGGFVTTMTYTGRNLLLTRTEAMGRAEAATEAFRYFLDGRAASRADARGFVWDTTWGACCGRLQGQLDPLVVLPDLNQGVRPARVSRHNDDGDLTHQGVVRNYDPSVFPILPNPINVTDLPDADTLQEITTRYDARHRPVASTVWLSPRGSVNANNPPIAGENGIPASAGLTTRWVYDEDLTDGTGLEVAYAAKLTQLGPDFFGPGTAGSAVATTNPDGETSVSVSDGTGRVVLSIDGVGDTVRTDFDQMVSLTPGAPGDLLVLGMVRDPAGLALTTAQRSDGAGRVLASVDALGKLTTMAYDAQGNRVQSRDPNLVGDDTRYDPRARPTVMTDTVGDGRFTIYDAEGNIVQTIDGEGAHAQGGPGAYPPSSQDSFPQDTHGATTCTFDPRNRRILCRDRIGAVTRYDYDPNSNLVGITDDEGGMTEYDYDPRNLLIAERFPGHKTPPDNYDQRLYAYDGARRLRSRDDQERVVTRYDYDIASRLLARVYPDGLNDTFTYDAASRLVTATSARYSNTVARAYLDDGLLSSETLTIRAQNYRVGYGYDHAKRNVGLTYPDGKLLTRTFTARDQLESLNWGQELVSRFEYDDGMRETRRIYGNGVITTRTWRPDNLVSTIQAPGVVDFGYEYDHNKRKRREADGILTDYSQNFGYDAEDRLVDWSRDRAPGELPKTQSWDLSPVGDWNTTTRDGAQESRSHNRVHELTSRTLPGAGAFAIGYDAKGNLIDDGKGQHYTWDPENRLQTADIAPVGLADGVDLWSGLVAHYRLDEARGTLTPDTSGKGHHATLVGGASVLPEGGRLLGAARIDGNGKHLNVPDHPDLHLSTFTLSAWFRVAPGLNTYRVITARQNGTTLRNWWLGVWQSTPTAPFVGHDLVFYAGTGARRVSLNAGVPVNDGQWHHVTAVVDGTRSASLYLDGRLVRTQANPTAVDLPAAPLIIGATDAAGGQRFSGDIDDTRIYSRALSAPEAAALAGLEQLRYFSDALGRRVRVHPSRSNGSRRIFAHASAQVVAEYDADREASSPSQRYLYGSYVDEPVLYLKESVKFFIHANALYSPAALTGLVGMVAERYKYDAYGRRIILNADGWSATDASEIGFQRAFTGYNEDSDTGLNFAKTRIWSSGQGRFINRNGWDAPLPTVAYHFSNIDDYFLLRLILGKFGMGVEGKFQGRLSPYSFFANDPVNWIEPYSPGGHHYVPREVWKDGVSEEAVKVFKDATTGYAPGHGNSKEHEAYNKAVKEEFDKYVTEKKIDPSKMTDNQAKEFLNRTKNSTHPDIGDFIKKWDAIAKKAARDAGGGIGVRLFKRCGKWVFGRVPFVTIACFPADAREGGLCYAVMQAQPLPLPNPFGPDPDPPPYIPKDLEEAAILDQAFFNSGHPMY